MAKLTIEADDHGLIRVSLDGDQVGLLRSLTLRAGADRPADLEIQVIDHGEGKRNARRLRDALPFARVDLIPLGQ